MFLLAAITLGFLGNFHCIGMCGPIALAIPVKRTSAFTIFMGTLLYNLGRVLTYSLMGIVFGLLGQGFVIAGWQNVLSISIGIIILLNLFIPKHLLQPLNPHMGLHLLNNVKAKIQKLFSKRSRRNLLFIGIMNGLLPCGLVYLGIAGAMATGNTLNGALFMAAFGLGTLPAMVTISVIRDYITVQFREKVRKAIPTFVAVMALLLILRGMNLGIPYLSPSITASNGVIHHKCCNK